MKEELETILRKHLSTDTRNSDVVGIPDAAAAIAERVQTELDILNAQLNLFKEYVRIDKDGRASIKGVMNAEKMKITAAIVIRQTELEKQIEKYL